MKKLKRSLLRFRSILALAASVILLAPFACSEPESTPQPPPIIPLEETLTPADIIADDGPTGEDIPLSGEADLVEESTTYFTVQMGAFSTRENAESAAEELVSSHGDAAAWQNFINNWVGSKFTPQTKTPPWTVLGRRLRGHHARGQVASRAFFVTLGADVQEDCVYWIARAWGEAASSWLVDWGCLHKRIDPSGGTRRDSHLAQLDALITREWPLAGVNPMQQTALPTLRTAIDTGHHPLLVHNFARQYHSERVLCVAGDSSPTAGQPWSFNVVEKNLRTGKPYPGGMRRWALNTDYFKTDLQDRWTLDRDDSGAWLVPDLPLDALADYLKQVANEGKVPRTDKKGRTQLQWVVLQPGLGNHYWDCEVYARAAAEMVVGTVWTDLAVRFQPPAPPREDDDRSQRFIPRRKGGGRWINR